MLESANPPRFSVQKKLGKSNPTQDARGVVIVTIRSSWEIVSLLGFFSWAGCKRNKEIRFGQGLREDQCSENNLCELL